MTLKMWLLASAIVVARGRLMYPVNSDRIHSSSRVHTALSARNCLSNNPTCSNTAVVAVVGLADAVYNQTQVACTAVKRTWLARRDSFSCTAIQCAVSSSRTHAVHPIKRGSYV